MNTIFSLNKSRCHLVSLLILSFLSFQAQAQLAYVIDNKGTIIDVRNNQVTTSLIAPANPLEGDTWIDTTTNTVKTWKEGTVLEWQEIAAIRTWINTTNGGVYTANHLVLNDGAIYKNLTGTNTDVTPDSDTTNWETIVGSIDLHSDVDTTTTPPANSDILQWNGTDWVPQAINNNFTIFPIWAEESSVLANNAFQWSYGNGDGAVVTQGIPIAIGGQIFAIGTSLVGATNTTISVLVNGTNVATSTAYTGTGSAITNLVIPINVSAGDLINFQTIVAGGAAEGKVVAWVRTGSIAAFNLNDLIDVDTTTISLNNGDLLQWNGVDWVGIPVPGIVSTDVGATAKITNAVSVNFNSSTAFVDKALGTTTFNEFNTDVSTDGTGFVINTAGTYRVNYSALLTSTGLRTTTISQINAGGERGGYSYSYIRNFSSINQAAVSSASVFQLNTGDTVRIQARREGTITIAANAAIGLAQLEITRVR